jgi:3-vinyl bacteriochlorophyllide hydratase
MYLALAAYATYIVNAGQFLWKLRVARLDYAAQLKRAQIAESSGTPDMGAGGVAA